MVSIDIDAPLNEDLYFFPAQQSVRGDFDFHRVREPKSNTYFSHWPEPIPGQRIEVDPETKTGRIIDRLRFEEHELARKKIEKLGSIPADKSFDEIDVTTWLYWMKRAVDSGLAKIAEGKFPAKLKGDPQKNFFGNTPVESNEDRLAIAIEKQTTVLEKLLTEQQR